MQQALATVELLSLVLDSFTQPELFSIASVCRDWYETVVEHPTYWRKHIIYSTADAEVRAFCARRRHAFGKPIDLIIKLGRKDPSGLRLANPLRGALSHVRTLDLALDETHLDLLTSLDASAPNIQSLVIDVSPRYPGGLLTRFGRIGPKLLGGTPIPHLSHVRLCNAAPLIENAMPAAFAHLRALTLEAFNALFPLFIVSEFLRAGVGCSLPNLREVALLGDMAGFDLRVHGGLSLLPLESLIVDIQSVTQFGTVLARITTLADAVWGAGEPTRVTLLAARESGVQLALHHGFVLIENPQPNMPRSKHWTVETRQAIGEPQWMSLPIPQL